MRVTDNGAPNLYDEEQITVTVGRRPTKLVYSGDASGQYSDAVSLIATLTDNGGGSLQGAPLAVKTISFVLGAQSTSAATNTSGLAQNTLFLTQSAAATTVASNFAGDTLYIGSSDSDPFQILREDATIEYSGDSIGRTGTNLSLVATVWDSAAAGYAGDRPETAPGATLGDITKMWIAFDIYPAGSCGTGTPTTRYARVYDTGVFGDGIGSATTIFSSSSEASYCVIARLAASATGGVNAWYQADFAQPGSIAFYNNVGQFATGGGWIIDPNGKKANFGFNARFNNKGVPKGQLVYVYRGMYNGVLADFIIKSNVIDALSFSGNTYPMAATLQGKCTIQINRASDGVQLFSQGNATFWARAVDTNLSSGAGYDSIELSVWDKNALLYKSVPVTRLGDGNMVIHYR